MYAFGSRADETHTWLPGLRQEVELGRAAVDETS